MAGTWMSSPPPPQQRGAGDGPFRSRRKDAKLRGALSVHTAPAPPLDESPAEPSAESHPAAPDPLAMLQEQLQPEFRAEAQDVAVTRRLVETRASEVRWARRIAATGWLVAVALAAVIVGLGVVAESTRGTIGRQQVQIDSARQHAARLTKRLVDGEAHIQTMQFQVERTDERLRATRAGRGAMLDELLDTERGKYDAVAKLRHRLKSAAEARVAAVRAQLDVSLASAPVPTPALPPGPNTAPDDGPSP